MQYDYAEILILGPCACKCFYCLRHEMPIANMNSQLTTHYDSWDKFDEFIKQAKELGIKKIYVSSTNTDPLLYKYIYDLIRYLRSEFELVGLRTNAANLTYETYRAVDLCNEISISLNAFTGAISEKIAGSHARTEFYNLCFWLEREKRLRLHKDDADYKIRIATVVNRYNAPEISKMLNELSYYNDLISYVQLRKVYKYSDEEKENFRIDRDSFDVLRDYLSTVYEKIGEFHTSPIYEFVSDEIEEEKKRHLDFSFWEDVFAPEEIRSFNYFTSGKISTNHLLIPGHEKD